MRTCEGCAHITSGNEFGCHVLCGDCLELAKAFVRFGLLKNEPSTLGRLMLFALEHEKTVDE